MQVPGPGNYENHEKLKMDPRGSYQFSKWRSSGAPVFSRSLRNTNLDTSVTRKSKLFLLINNLLKSLPDPAPTGPYPNSATNPVRSSAQQALLAIEKFLNIEKQG